MTAAAARGVEIAERLPASVNLAVYTADAAQSCNGFLGTSLGQTLSGAEFAPLVKALVQREMAGPLNLRPAFGFDWSDVAQTRQPAALVLLPTGEDDSGAVCLFLNPAASPGEPPLLAKARAHFTAQGFKPSEQKLAAGTVTVFARTAQRETVSRVIFRNSDSYGVANSVAAAEAVLNVTAQTSLSANADFAKSQAAEESADRTDAKPATANFYIRPWQLQEQLERSAKQPPPETAAKVADEKPPVDPVESNRRLGLDAVRAIAGRIDVQAANPCEWEVTAHIVAPPPYDRALRMLELEAGPFAPPPTWVSATAASVWRWRWDFNKAILGFGNLFDELNEPGPDGEGLFTDLLDGLRDDPEGVMVDLRRDLFGQLGRDVLFVDDSPSSASHADAEGERTLYAVSVEDLATVAAALHRFYKDDERVTHERVGSFDLWTVPPGASLFVEGESDSVVTIRALAVGGSQLLFGTDVDLLRSAIAARPADAPFSSAPGCQQVLSWIERVGKDEIALWALSRLAHGLETPYASASRAPEKDAVDTLGTTLVRVFLFGTADAQAPAPYAEVPAFDRWRTSLGIAGTVLLPAADGWQLRWGTTPGEAPTRGKAGPER